MKFLAISGFGTWGRGVTREDAIKKMCKYDSRSKTSYYLYESDDDTIEVDSMGMILTEPNCYLHKIEIKVRGKKSVAFDWKAADEAEAKHFAKLKSDWEAAHPGKTAQDPKEVNNG